MTQIQDAVNMTTIKLKEFIESCQKDFDNISHERKEKLEILSKFIQDNISDSTLNLIFICIHNSRRSHLSQVWAQVAAHHYGFNNVYCYSGGTEVTAMYPAIAKTLIDQGLNVVTIAEGKNPVYSIKYSENAHPIVGFSKLFDDSFNPQSDFGAVMVCSAADKNCPFIATAAQRILVPFEDPKAFDDTPQQKEKYAERSKQIATELLYTFSLVKS